mgnify:CR=1 FL=1
MHLPSPVALRTALLLVLTALGTLTFPLTHLLLFVGILGETATHAGHDHADDHAGSHDHLAQLASLASSGSPTPWMMIASTVFVVAAVILVLLMSRRVAIGVAVGLTALVAAFGLFDGIMHGATEGIWFPLAASTLCIALPAALGILSAVPLLRQGQKDAS